MDGYTTRLTGLEPAEADTLFLLGLGHSADALGVGGSLDSAARKVLAALPTDVRKRALAVGERVHVAGGSWFGNEDDLGCLPTVAHAVWSTRQIQIEYERDDRIRAMTLDPFGLVMKAGRWYLVARRTGEMRTFRCSRISSAKLLEDSFERPDGWNLSEYWRTSERALTKSQQHVRIELLADSSSRGTLEFLFGQDTIAGAFRRAEPTGVADRFAIEFDVESMAWARDDLLRLGSSVEVLGPPVLRREIGAIAARMAALYGLPPLAYGGGPET